MHPERHLEEMLKDVRDHLSLSTITASGVRHGDALTGTETALLLPAGRGASIRRSDTGCRKTGQTYGRMRAEGEMMGELPVILKRGGTPCSRGEEAAWCRASRKKRAVFTPGQRVEERHRPGVTRWNPRTDPLIVLSKSRGQRVDPS